MGSSKILGGHLPLKTCLNTELLRSIFSSGPSGYSDSQGLVCKTPSSAGVQKNTGIAEIAESLGIHIRFTE